MKWGHYYEASSHEQLLYWVLQCVLRPYNLPLDRWLKHALSGHDGFGGDPGWSMEHMRAQDGSDWYRVWADPDTSGIEPAEEIYSADVVHRALRDSLLAFGEMYPERKNEVQEVLQRYVL